MKKSLNAWTLEGHLSFEESFAAVKNAGFDGIELNLDGSGAHSLTLDTTEETYAEIRALSEKYALPVVSISTSQGGQLGTDNPEVKAQMKKVLFKQIEAAKALGASGVLTVPGGMSATVTLDAARRNSIAFLKEIKPEIEASGIIVGVENVWNGFFLSPYDMVSFIDEVDSPAVGAYFDAGNMLAFSVPEYWVEVIGSRIKFVHVKDYKRNGGLNSGGTWRDITHGSANWAAIIPELKKAGFDGYLTGEVFNDGSVPFPDYYAKVANEIGSIIQ